MKKALILIAIVLIMFGAKNFLALRSPASIAEHNRPIPQIDLPSGTLSVVAMGTSLTANYSWPAGFGENLSKCLGSPVSVTKVAMAGKGSDWGLTQVQSVLALRPNLVLIEFLLNDSDFFDGVRLQVSIRNHEKILDAIAMDLPETKFALMIMNPVVGLRKISRPKLVKYRQSYVGIAQEYDTGLIDTSSRWASVTDIEYVNRDGLHPNDALASELLVPMLSEAVGRSLGKAC